MTHDSGPIPIPGGVQADHEYKVVYYVIWYGESTWQEYFQWFVNGSVIHAWSPGYNSLYWYDDIDWAVITSHNFLHYLPKRYLDMDWFEMGYDI